MFLSLEFPGGDKGISLFVRDLKGEDDFRPQELSFTRFDSDRCKANAAINECNEVLGVLKTRGATWKAFTMLFNQFSWAGTTGWEYWSDDYTLVFQHALLVAEELGLPLHVHSNTMDMAIEASAAAKIDFGYEAATKLANPRQDPAIVYLNRDILQGRYYRLSNVALPPSMPKAPRICRNTAIAA